MIATEADLAAITSRIVCSEPVTAVYLFGSYAKGTAHDESDVDLLIVGRYRVPPPHRGRHAAAALKRFPLRFDLLFYTPHELDEAVRNPKSFATLALRRARLLHGHPAFPHSRQPVDYVPATPDQSCKGIEPGRTGRKQRWLEILSGDSWKSSALTPSPTAISSTGSRRAHDRSGSRGPIRGPN